MARVTLACVTLLLLVASPAKGQGLEIVWSEPTNLSRETPGDSFQPAVLADSFGYVHVLWEERVDLGQGVQGGYLFYTGWDGREWSPPVDVLLTPGAYSTVRTPAAAVDPNRGMLHMVWTGARDLYYSRARVDQARSARAWARPVPIIGGQVYDPYLVVHDGALHLVYLDIGEEPGIWYTTSSDGGDTWRDPVRLSQPTLTQRPLPYTTETVQLRADERGRLHVVWVDRLDGGIYYVRSLDGGQTWEQPIQLDNEGTWPSVGILGDEVHVLWSATHEGPSCARRERISTDGGASWHEMTRVLSPLMNCLGWMNMEVDSSGTMHVVTVGGAEAGEGRDVHGLYHASWTGGGWSTPELIKGTIVPGSEWQQRGPDRPRASLQLGNRLHVVWYTNDGEVWYTMAELEAPRESPSPLPPVPTVAPLPPTPTVQPTVEVATPRPSRSFTDNDAPLPPARSGSVLVPAVLISVVFTLVGILIAVIGVQVRRNRVR